MKNISYTSNIMIKLYDLKNFNNKLLPNNLYNSLLKCNYNTISILDDKMVKWEINKVGSDSKNVEDLSVRDSYKISEYFCEYTKSFIKCRNNISFNEDYINTYFTDYILSFNKILISKFGSNFRHEGKYNFIIKDYKNNERFWRVHKYLKGGKFDKHSDGKINQNHIGTLVLIPPKNFSEYEGGELILYNMDDDNIVDEIIVSDKNGWQLVFIQIGQKHMISEIVKGIRFSLTSPYFISEVTKKTISSTIYSNKIDDSKMMVLSNENKTNIIKNIDLQIKMLQDEKNKLISSFDKLDLNFSYIDIIKSYIKYEDSFIVFCKNFYDNPSPDVLTFEDANIFNFLVENKKNVTFFNLSVIIDAGNSPEMLDDNEWSTINDEYGRSVYDIEPTKFNNSFIIVIYV